MAKFALGLIALALGLIILTALKWVEDHWKQDRQATLTIVTGENRPTEKEITKALAEADCKIIISSITYGEDGAAHELICQIRWRARANEAQPPEAVKELAARFHFLKMNWRIIGNQ